MKRIIILVFCIFTAALSAGAQDIIVKKDGTELNAKVVSIDDKTVEYKRSDYLEGPTFSIDVKELKSITYANGEKQEFVNKARQEIVNKGISLRMAYDDYKNLYDPSQYERAQFDPYSPVGSGIASFFIPGLGQMINGQADRGMWMLFGDLALVVGGVVVGMVWSEKNADGKSVTTTGGKICMLACFCGSLAIDIWSICDAVKMAKIKNLYYRDCKVLMSDISDIKLMPSLACVPAGQSIKAAPGLTLAVRF